MFHYTVLNLFIHHFSIQNPFSRNINAPTELESSAGGEKRWKKKKKTLTKKKQKGGKKKSIFYKKKRNFSVITMIVINYLCMYIYTHIYICIYMYINLYIFLPCPWGGERGFVAPCCPSFRRPHWAAGRTSQPDSIQVIISVRWGQSWPIAVFLTCKSLSHPLTLLCVSELILGPVPRCRPAETQKLQ